MNNEIKEILDFIKKQIEKGTLSYEPDVELSKEEAHLLLDYITNLQQKYQDAINQSIEDHKYASKKEDEALDYKSRIEKAVEYIKEDYERNQEVIEYCSFDEFYKKLLNILNGKE